MLYGEDGKFYLEPEPDEIAGYQACFVDLGNTDAAVILDPECVGPMFVFNTTTRYGQDKAAMLDALIALREAADTLTGFEKQTEQIFYFVNGYVYKPLGKDCREPADYFPMAKSAPAKVELCMN